MTMDLQAGHLLTTGFRARMETSVTPDAALASEPDSNRESWERVIDEKLVEWGRYPKRLEENDLMPPTREALQAAVELVILMRDQRLPPPTRVVPDRDGGLAFERQDGERTITIMVSSEGCLEAIRWLGSKIVSAKQLG